MLRRKCKSSWWRHQMETFSALLALCVGGIPWSLGNSPQQGQWRRALMFSLVCHWINGSVNNHEAGDLRRHHAHYDITVMFSFNFKNKYPNPKQIYIMRCKLIYNKVIYKLDLKLIYNITYGNNTTFSFKSCGRERQIKFISLLGTEDIGVHIVHISCVIITYTLE